MEIAKRLNAIIAQLLPFLSSEVTNLPNLRILIDLILIISLIFPAPAAGSDRSGESQTGHNAGTQHHSWGESPVPTLNTKFQTFHKIIIIIYKIISFLIKSNENLKVKS